MSEMTFRDCAAIAALQGLLSNPGTRGTPTQIVQSAWLYADGLVKARNFGVEIKPEVLD